MTVPAKPVRIALPVTVKEPGDVVLHICGLLQAVRVVQEALLVLHPVEAVLLPVHVC